MLTPIISGDSLVQEYRRFRLMLDLPVQTATAQKVSEAVHFATMMHSIHHIALPINPSHGR